MSGTHYFSDRSAFRMRNAVTLGGPSAARPFSLLAPRFYIPFMAVLLAVFASLPAFAIDRVDLVNPDLEALARLPMINLPPPPAWKSVQQDAAWTVDDIAAEFAKVANRPPAINTVRSTFIRPDHQWIVAYTTWFSHLNKALKLAFKDQVWDCDNFTRSFVAFADILALRGGEARGSLCVGYAKVANREAFGEVYGSDMGSHALVVVGTSKGLFVIEPQSGKIAALRDYPNSNEFQEINF